MASKNLCSQISFKKNNFLIHLLLTRASRRDSHKNYIMKKILLMFTVMTYLLTSCGNSGTDEHDHGDGTHDHGDGTHEDHDGHEHDSSTHHQEEFDVTTDTSAVHSDHDHEHDNAPHSH